MEVLEGTNENKHPAVWILIRSAPKNRCTALEFRPITDLIFPIKSGERPPAQTAASLSWGWFNHRRRRRRAPTPPQMS